MCGHTNDNTTLIFNADGSSLITGSRDRTIQIWDVETAKCQKTLRGHAGLIFISCSPDNRMIVSGSADNTIKVWDLQSGECLIALADTGWICAVAWSPDGQLVASGGDGYIRLWDVKTWQCVKTLHGYHSWVYAIAFSPDGQTLASGRVDLTLRL